jgi:hypothetical protein
MPPHNDTTMPEINGAQHTFPPSVPGTTTETADTPIVPRPVATDGGHRRSWAADEIGL